MRNILLSSLGDCMEVSDVASLCGRNHGC
jgi:hypothetical protein